MSQLLNRVVKPIVCKKFLRHNTNNMVRWCSSMPIYPYMLLDYMLQVAYSGKDSSDGRIAIGEYSCAERTQNIVIKDISTRDEVCNVMTLGYYNGALKVGLLDKKLFKTTNNVRLYIHYKPEDATLKTVSIRLPHLPSDSVIQNIAMSSHPDLDNKDWVVAVKLYGSKVRLHRPACSQEPRWVDVKSMPQSINTSSSLMYSKKDQRFYVPTPGGDYLYSLDPNSKKNDPPEFVYIFPDDVPEHLDLELDEMNSATSTLHFVEAPSGEQFLVKWFFMDELEIKEGVEQVTTRTRQFMVFRAEDHPNIKNRKIVSYTENIGDFCIFIGHGEPYCVRASSRPGLKSNSIYFMGYNFGVYDITYQRCRLFYTKFVETASLLDSKPLMFNQFPYWPHPLSLDS